MRSTPPDQGTRGENGDATKDGWSTKFTVRAHLHIKNFSRLPTGANAVAEMVAGSRQCVPTTSRQASPPGGRLKVHPWGVLGSVGHFTHLSVWLEMQDSMWAPTAEYRMTLVNKDTRKSYSQGVTTKKFGLGVDSRATADAFFKLAALSDAAAGWLVDNMLVLMVDVAVQCEEFQVDTGGVPCDVALKLPCGAELPFLSIMLHQALPFFRGALEDKQGGDPFLLDGSLSTWIYILSDLYPQGQPPTLTLDGVYMLLPVVHKYNLPRLHVRLVAFVKEHSAELSADPKVTSTSVMRWMSLAESLQLDELHDLCYDRLVGIEKKLEVATIGTAAVRHGVDHGAPAVAVIQVDPGPGGDAAPVLPGPADEALPFQPSPLEGVIGGVVTLLCWGGLMVACILGPK
ncbi:hypothetical protein FOA52_002186 [Chlamydomonas sp. UWO 241]|nr:hypothetical protein FOA52_002186 [Chlamydomonas sp. UWO 241]